MEGAQVDLLVAAQRRIDGRLGLRERRRIENDGVVPFSGLALCPQQIEGVRDLELDVLCPVARGRFASLRGGCSAVATARTRLAARPGRRGKAASAGEPSRGPPPREPP